MRNACGSTSAPSSPLVTSCIKAYGDGLNFLRIFNPDAQYGFCKNLRRCFTGTAPSLHVLAQAFGNSTAESWLEIQINDLSEFSGCKDKLSIRQQEQIARTVIATYGHLKVTELMYFFLLFKGGHFGKFYGAVDGLVITEALNAFSRIRLERLQTYEREEQDRRREEETRHRAQTTMTYAEWTELKWMFNMGYEPWRIKRELAAQRAEGGAQ